MASNRVNQMQAIQEEALELFKRKNSDYGDAFANFGSVGVMVRLTDKLSRFINIQKSSVSLVNNETLRDTLIDLHNYAAMAIMLLDENKKDKQRDDEERKKEADNQVYLIEPHMPIY